MVVKACQRPLPGGCAPLRSLRLSILRRRRLKSAFAMAADALANPWSRHARLWTPMTPGPKHPLFDQIDPARVCEVLAPFIADERRARIDQVLAARLAGVTV